jgi:hypothetical protein
VQLLLQPLEKLRQEDGLSSGLEASLDSIVTEKNSIILMGKMKLVLPHILYVTVSSKRIKGLNVKS